MLFGAHVSAAAGVDLAIDHIDERLRIARVWALHVNDTEDPSARTATCRPTSAAVVCAGRLGVFLGYTAFHDLPAILETSGVDGKGPGAAEMRKLDRLCSRAGIPIGGSRHRARAARA